jgi:hypothetical protein
MLWYGFIYYLLFFFLIFFFIIFFSRLFYLNFINKLLIYNYLIKISLGFFIFFSFVSLTTLYYIYDYFSNFFYLTDTNSSIVIYDNLTLNFLLNLNTLNLNLIYVYYFPFIYIFLLITVLSILFCLSYSFNELISFVFYCSIILISGYILFFTDSLILFFLSYEMLLIPSFFILYKFAKTRKCIEASYLMFF